MQVIGVRDLKNHLSEYVRRVCNGEAFHVKTHGKVVAELRPAEGRNGEAIPPALQALISNGLTNRVVRNNPDSYRRLAPLLAKTSVKEILDRDREDRR